MYDENFEFAKFSGSDADNVRLHARLPIHHGHPHAARPCLGNSPHRWFVSVGFQ